MKKKLLVVFSLLGLVVTLVSCGGMGAPTQETPTPTTTGTTNSTPTTTTPTTGGNTQTGGGQGTTTSQVTDERYEIYLLAQTSGYTGTYEEWLESIKGEAIVLSVQNGVLKWKYKTEGTSEYRTLFDLSILRGLDGSPGSKGDPGLSAYELYKKYHTDYTGTEEDYVRDYLSGVIGSGSEGTPGQNGLSAYELYKKYHP